MELLLALAAGLATLGVFFGIRMYGAEARLPGDLAVALEVGSSRTGWSAKPMAMAAAPMKNPVATCSALPLWMNRPNSSGPLIPPTAVPIA